MNDSQFYQLIDNLSQLTAYTIGRSVDNQLVLPQSKISGHHARLIQCTSTSFIVEDLSSKNGTFVNEVRITRKVVDQKDTLRLADTLITVEELLAQLPVAPASSTVEAAPATPQKIPQAEANPLDFTSAFADLQQVYVQYPILRKDCRNREKMIRTGSVILSSIVGISSVLSTGGAALPLLHIMSGAGLSMLVPTLCSTLLSTEEKLEVIDKEYREKYRCPNPACRDPFGNREWELLVQQKSCRRCQAIWVN
ncbi:hypothetical protein GCM10028818_06610 [Spirosoma horti]